MLLFLRSYKWNQKVFAQEPTSLTLVLSISIPLNDKSEQSRGIRSKDPTRALVFNVSISFLTAATEIVENKKSKLHTKLTSFRRSQLASYLAFLWRPVRSALALQFLLSTEKEKHSGWSKCLLYGRSQVWGLLATVSQGLLSVRLSVYLAVNKNQARIWNSN